MEIKINSQKMPGKNEALQMNSIDLGNNTLIYWEIVNVKTNDKYIEENTKNIINLAKSTNDVILMQNQQLMNMLINNTNLKKDNENLKKSQMNMLVQLTKLQKGSN